MRIINAVVSLTVPCCLLLAQPPRRSSESGGLRLDVQSVLDSARAAPPEFAADVLITVTDSGLITDRKKKIELLEEAYSLASGAQDPVGLDRAGAGPLNYAFHDLFGLGLDQVSLRARAVRSLIPLDTGRAVDLYAQISLPLDQRFSCEQPVWYRLAIYYSVLPQILKSVPEPLKRDHILTDMLARFRSASQVQPIADILTSLLNDNATDLDHILYGFADRLTKLDGDSRTFTSSFVLSAISLRRLALQCPAGMRQHLVEQARQWVIQATRHGICLQKGSKQMSMDGTISHVDPAHPINRFNQELASLSESNPAIELKNLDAPLPGPLFETDRYSADFIKFDQMRRLLDGEESEAKDTLRWRSEVEKYLVLVVGWKNPKPNDTDPTQFYLEKAELLQQLLALKKNPPPDKPLLGAAYDEYVHKNSAAGYASRDQVALALINHFDGPEGTIAYRKRRSLWFARVRWLLRSQENTPALDDLLARSSNPVLSLYGQVAKLEASAGRAFF